MILYKGSDVEIHTEVLPNPVKDEYIFRKTRSSPNKKTMVYDKAYISNSRFSAEERALTAENTACRTYLNKKGYYKTRAEAIDAINKIDSCLLLSKYKEDGVWPKVCMFKVDGLRCRWNGTQLLTRGGKVIKGLDHIVKELHTDIPTDGELYIPNTQLETIQSTVLSGDEDKSEVIYLLFDEPSLEKPYKIRLKEMSERGYNGSVQVLPYWVCKDSNEADTLYDKHVAEGWEGSVYRNPDSVYEPKRSNSCMKRKPLLSIEVAVVSSLRDKDGLIFFELEYEGKRFKSVPSWEDKVRLESTYDTIPEGYKATIEFQAFTKNNIPKFSNVITIRSPIV